MTINPETASFTKAGKDIDGHFLLPLGHHPWHRLHTHSYCVMVALEDGKRLLIPCMELIRFYFGSSSIFLQRLFTEPLGRNTLWTSKTFDPYVQHLHLVLADRISGVSASDIGRIAQSQFAWRSAAGIYSSCMRASMQEQPIYPCTGFPFEGYTDLEVSGIWLPFGEQENQTFLVYQIHSCTHPFPFKKLTYNLADSRVAVDAANRGKGNKRGGVRAPSDNAEVVNKEAGNSKSGRTALFMTNVKFPDLARKKVWRLKGEAMELADVFLRKADGSLEQIAFGESGYATDHAGFDLQQYTPWQENKDQPLPQFVIDGLKMLAEDPQYGAIGYELKVVCPPGKKSPIFDFPYIVDEDGEIEGESIFVKDDGGIRQRRGCWCEVGGITIRYFVIQECLALVRHSRPMIKPLLTFATTLLA